MILRIGRIRVLDQYVFMEIAKVFFLGILIFMTILILEKVHFLSELILNNNVPTTTVLRLLTYISPAFLSVTIPLAVLLATIMTFSRFSADNEITAMRACGISVPRLLYPVGALAFLAFLITAFCTLYAQHWGNYNFRKEVVTIMKSAANYSIKERVFNDEFLDLVIYVEEKPSNSRVFNGIFISDATQEKPRVITSREGVIDYDRSTNQLIFQMRDGTIHVKTSIADYRLIHFSEYNLVLEAGACETGEFIKAPREMSVSEIHQRIKEQVAAGLPANSEKVEFHKKLSLPFSCIVLGLLGVPLGIRFQRGGGTGGFGLAVLAIFFNYGLMVAGQGLGSEGKIPPALAMWGPNLLIGTIGVYLVIRITRESMPLGLMSAWLDFKERLLERILKRLWKD